MSAIKHVGKRKDNGETVTGFYMEHKPFTEIKGYIKTKSIIGPVKWVEVDRSTVSPDKTTSQKETIERLREGNQILKKALNIIIGFEEYRGRVGCTYGDTEFDSMAAEKGFNDCLCYVKSIASTRLKEAEQLLNTTEPTNK